MHPGARGYDSAAKDLIIPYELLAFEEVHAAWLDLIPQQSSDILDIGAGTGRDAAYLASRGHRVTAVEPAHALRHAGMKLHADQQINWMADALPELTGLSGHAAAFDLILLVGVWAHLAAGERREAMLHLARLLRPGGRLLISLRHGPSPAGRPMYAVPASDVIADGTAAGLTLIRRKIMESIQPGNRALGVSWTMLAFSG
jgi:SAM-dependent methyltransferase